MFLVKKFCKNFRKFKNAGNRPQAPGGPSRTGPGPCGTSHRPWCLMPRVGGIASQKQRGPLRSPGGGGSSSWPRGWPGGSAGSKPSRPCERPGSARCNGNASGRPPDAFRNDSHRFRVLKMFAKFFDSRLTFHTLEKKQDYILTIFGDAVKLGSALQLLINCSVIHFLRHLM